MRLIRWAVTAALAGVVLVGCSQDGNLGGGDSGSASALGHVHGLGTDPRDGTLYVASHFGVFRIGEDGSASRVADRWQDTMAFTVVGAGHFLASGHPDLREDLPPHLGLIESKDSARTWTPVSLQGKADFHALEPAGDRIYGYDAVSGRLLMSSDGREWRSLATAPLVDLAADAGNPGQVLATTPDGKLWAYDETGRRQPVDAPPLVFLDWPVSDLLVGLAPDGRVYVSRDGASTWTQTGQVAGDVQALDVTSDRWHVATSHGVHVSTDEGRRWERLVSGHG